VGPVGRVRRVGRRRAARCRARTGDGDRAKATSEQSAPERRRERTSEFSWPLNCRRFAVSPSSADSSVHHGDRWTLQPVPDVTQADVERVVSRDFPPQEHQTVFAVLSEYGTKSWQREQDRVRLAVLKLADRDLEQLRQNMNIALCDYRDVLSCAEYPLYCRKVDPNTDRPGMVGWRVGNVGVDPCARPHGQPEDGRPRGGAPTGTSPARYVVVQMRTSHHIGRQDTRTYRTSPFGHGLSGMMSVG
jgi:hypothetical protein